MIIGDFAFYDTWDDSGHPKLLLTMNCSVGGSAGGSDSLHGGDGDVDYTIGGSLNDAIYGDDKNSTNVANSDVIFGDYAEIMFYGNVSHRLQEAVTIDGNCSSAGNDIISLGPGDDVVSLMASDLAGKVCSLLVSDHFTSSIARHLAVISMTISKARMGRISLSEISPSTRLGTASVIQSFCTQ